MHINLEDLIGVHKFSGVDFSVEPIERYGSLEDCSVVNFVLDGKTYTVVEDPSDGYRSAMRDIVRSKYKVKNKFQPVKVLCMMRIGRYEGDYDVLDIVDLITAKVVLSVGTDHTDTYYPSFVSEWKPQNLHLNAVQQPQTDN